MISLELSLFCLTGYYYKSEKQESLILCVLLFIGGSIVLEILVHEIKGKCPVYKVGDRIVIKDPEIVLKQTNALCTHALSTLLHYVLILEHNWCPVKLGLTTSEEPEHAYMQCVDPGEPYTEGGTVIFKCRRINSNKLKD